MEKTTKVVPMSMYVHHLTRTVASCVVCMHVCIYAYKMHDETRLYFLIHFTTAGGVFSGSWLRGGGEMVMVLVPMLRCGDLVVTVHCVVQGGTGQPP